MFIDVKQRDIYSTKCHYCNFTARFLSAQIKDGNTFLSKCADKNTPMYIYVGLAYRGLLNHKYFEKADHVTWLFVKSFCTLFPIKRCQPYQGWERRGLKLNTCIWSSWGKLVHFSGAPPFSNLRGSPCIGFSLTAHQEILCCKAVFTQGGDYFFPELRSKLRYSDIINFWYFQNSPFLILLDVPLFMKVSYN